MTMPNFIFGGAGKSGTTSLYYYLAQHPEVFTSSPKEPAFFSFVDKSPSQIPEEEKIAYNAAVKTLKDYQQLFAGSTGIPAVGEASQRYFSDLYAIKAIARHLPEVKLVFFLRNPIERAWSHFIQFRRDGRESRENLLEILAETPPEQSMYTRTGFYAQWLARWGSHFPSSQIYIGLYDDFRADPLATTQDVFRFLEVDSTFEPDTRLRANLTGLPRSQGAALFLAGANRLKYILKRIAPNMNRAPIHKLYSAALRRLLVRPEIEPELRDLLSSIYEEDVRALETITGRDLSHWIPA